MLQNGAGFTEVKLLKTLRIMRASAATVHEPRPPRIGARGTGVVRHPGEGRGAMTQESSGSSASFGSSPSWR